MLIHGRPFKNPQELFMAIFNEIAASAYLYIMLLLTDFWGESTIRNEIGWGLFFFLGFVVCVNVLKALKNFIIWSF